MCFGLILGCLIWVYASLLGLFDGRGFACMCLPKGLIFRLLCSFHPTPLKAVGVIPQIQTRNGSLAMCLSVPMKKIPCLYSKKHVVPSRMRNDKKTIVVASISRHRVRHVNDGTSKNRINTLETSTTTPQQDWKRIFVEIPTERITGKCQSRTSNLIPVCVSDDLTLSLSLVLILSITDIAFADGVTQPANYLVGSTATFLPVMQLNP